MTKLAVFVTMGAICTGAMFMIGFPVKAMEPMGPTTIISSTTATTSLTVGNLFSLRKGASEKEVRLHANGRITYRGGFRSDGEALRFVMETIQSWSKSQR